MAQTPGTPFTRLTCARARKSSRGSGGVSGLSPLPLARPRTSETSIQQSLGPLCSCAVYARATWRPSASRAAR
eukprot:3017807-Alexandrium_andersonii.AAC.1